MGFRQEVERRRIVGARDLHDGAQQRLVALTIDLGLAEDRIDADPAAAKREVRKPSFRPGTVAFMTGERMSVMVTDVSEKGARVRFVRRGLLPERVQLIEPLQGINTWGYVAWQNAGEAGLRFVGATRTGG